MAVLIFHGNSNALAGSSYTLDLLTPSTSVTALDTRLSINDTGTVAFAAQDRADSQSKVFIAPICATPPCPLKPISFFGTGRLFSGASINNGIPPLVLSTDRFSGAPPTFFLRTWRSDASNSFRLFGSSAAGDFSSVTGFLGLADNGDAVATTAVGPSFNPALFFYQFPSVSPTAAVFSSGAILRPQIAKRTSDVAVNVPPGQIFVYRATGTPRFVAGVATGHSNLGSAPGISEDGSVIGFYGTKAGTNEVDIELAFAADTSSSPTISHVISNVVKEGSEGVSSLSASASNRIAVLSKIGPSFQDRLNLPHKFQMVTVTFAGVVAVGSGPPVAGIFSRDMLFEAVGDGAGNYSFKTRAKAPIVAVAQSGDVAGSVTLQSPFGLWESIATSRTGDPATTQADEEKPLIALTAADSAGALYAVRATRSCKVPTGLLPDNKQVGHPETLGFSPSGNSISKAGCRLTDIAVQSLAAAH